MRREERGEEGTGMTLSCMEVTVVEGDESIWRMEG